MARPTPAPAKEPGRLKQMWQVFQMTRRYDGTIVLYLLLAFLAPIGAGIVLAVIFGAGNPVLWILYIVAGVLAGVLLSLIVLGRRAEKAAFSQIEGQAGAVGAVLKSSLRRSWTGNEIPINFNKTQDAVYRAVGKGGVVLIGEGPRTRTQPMLDKERANVRRILPEVPVHLIYVDAHDPEATSLHRIVPTLAKYKRALNKSEIQAVSNRLQSLGKNGLPIPKGIDPQRVRAPRPR
ncbi:DUF4191 domain-containing protein [Pseudolysinimonas yzui]|uniref:Membrane protein n=1 Tax=Pseudolysinimonas yzui TaxID=2708254 RepID=A0A8J3LZ07_9MICO|nr:DUF4191 domain-containing protein [Pseudolysinimonas yzui]GHF08242.1 membrane protein [Pseudolysinimonas yzui]